MNKAQLAALCSDAGQDRRGGIESRHQLIFRCMAILALAFFSSLSGAAALERVMVLSYGSNNCERFVRAPRLEKQMYLSWTEGFVSAANMSDAGPSRMAGIFWNRAAKTNWLQSYCTQNPKEGFILAAEALRVALGGHKSK